jgi:ElaB/YqjD/DUF883 family membrane-anchored ribosome-binding protein
MTAEASKELENIKQDLADLKKDIKGLTMALKDVGKQQVDETTEKLCDKKDDLLENFSLGEIKERLEELKGDGAEAVDVVRQQVEKNPLGTVLAAVGIGILLSKLLSSGNR